MGVAGVTLAPLAEPHFASLHRALDAIARERRWFAFLAAPPVADAYAYYRRIVELDLCHVVALRDGEVVGWCDVLPSHPPGGACSHTGKLGIGVLARERGAGVGELLLRAAVARARDQGFTRIELMVRVDNPRAIALYERVGFAHEGVLRHAFRVDDEYIDGHAMALLCD